MTHVRKHPRDVNFLDTFPHPPPGWEKRNVFSLGITNRALILLPEDASYVRREARTFFYPGFHEPYYPHLICLDDRDCLEDIVLGIFAAKGLLLNGEATRFAKQIEALIRPTFAYVHKSLDYVVPTGDSRSMWPARTHDTVDMEKVPKAVRPLTKALFWSLIRQDPHCFLASLGRSSAANR